MSSLKSTPPDEELKIIVFSPSFVLHYINEVLLFVPLGRLKHVHTGAYRITVDFTPVTFSPTHCPHVDVDVSLKDFPPVSSEAVLPLLPFPPSPLFVFSFLFFILHDTDGKNSRKTKK